MAGQKFYASPTDTFTWPNGAVGHRPGGPFDCLGPFAKVRNCPVIVDDIEVARLTCYATGIADTFFSVPAVTERKGSRVVGYFTTQDNPLLKQAGGVGVVFQVMDRCKALFADVLPEWRVVVGNYGTVWSGFGKAAAMIEFEDYNLIAAAAHGRMAGEEVTLFRDDEVIAYRQSRHDDELDLAADRAEDRKLNEG